MSLNISLSHPSSLKFIENGTIRCWRSVVTMALASIIFEIKRDIDRKSRIFSHPTCIRRPRCHKAWYIKTRMVGQPDDEKV